MEGDVVSNEVATIDLDTLRAHLVELEAEHAETIAIEWGTYKGGKGAVASLTSRKVRLPWSDIRSAADYATVMHEFGHLLGPWQRPAGKRYRQTAVHGRLVEEAGAWVWAKENAVAWTPAMERNMNDALQSYARHAARKSWRGNVRVVPGARHVFWKLAGTSRSAFHFNERNVRRPSPVEKAPQPQSTPIRVVRVKRNSADAVSAETEIN